MENSYIKNRTYKALPFLSMLYFCIMISANVLIYRLTQFGNITISVGTFVIPFWYVLGDIITEVYGYQNTRKVIWCSLICVFIFSSICVFMSKLPVADISSNYLAYDEVLGRLLRVFLGMIVAVILGSFINIYIIAKWKILILGRSFWLRSIGSSAIGQFLFTFVAMVFDLFYVIPLHDLIELIIVAYMVKLIFTPLVAIPSNWLAEYLKKLEGIDIYDTDTDFNIFKLAVK